MYRETDLQGEREAETVGHGGNWNRSQTGAGEDLVQKVKLKDVGMEEIRDGEKNRNISKTNKMKILHRPTTELS